MADLAAFVGVSLVVICTPGQDTALTVRNTLVGGRRNGVFTALGVVTGQAAWTLAASAGLAALLLASQTAFGALKLLGAAYLVYLGLRALADALSRRPRAHAAQAPVRVRTGYRQGLLSNLGNAKMVVFFTSLLPQFGSGFFELAALGLLFASLTLAWLALYASVVARAGDVLRRPTVRRALDAVSGVAFVGLGVRLAAARRP